MRSLQSFEKKKKKKVVIFLLISKLPFPDRHPRASLFYAVFGVKSRMPVWLKVSVGCCAGWQISYPSSPPLLLPFFFLLGILYILQSAHRGLLNIDTPFTLFWKCVGIWMMQHHKLRNLEYFSGKVCLTASVQTTILKLSFQIYCLLLELRRISITKLYCSNACKNIQHFILAFRHGKGKKLNIGIYTVEITRKLVVLMCHWKLVKSVYTILYLPSDNLTSVRKLITTVNY